MNKITMIFLLVVIISWTDGVCQKDNNPRYFGEPILTDTLSTIFIPTRYNQEFLSTNKIAFWSDYYANIVVYNFKVDTYKKLFDTDTYIEGLQYGSNYRYRTTNDDKIKNLTSKWILLLVKNKDYNRSGRIDEHDPSTLFATTTKGENLRPLTDESEDVVSFDVFDGQGFVMLKIRRDKDKDRSFKSESFYYKKIDLNDLSFGKEIELK